MVPGQVKVTPVTVELDERENGFHGVFEWENSFEAEVFLAVFGVSVEPVCWAELSHYELSTNYQV